MSASSKHIHCFVGVDMEGDACIYIKRGPCDGKGNGYLSERKLRIIAADLQDRLNRKKPKSS